MRALQGLNGFNELPFTFQKLQGNPKHRILEQGVKKIYKITPKSTMHKEKPQKNCLTQFQEQPCFIFTVTRLTFSSHLYLIFSVET